MPVPTRDSFAVRTDGTIDPDDGELPNASADPVRRLNKLCVDKRKLQKLAQIDNKHSSHPNRKTLSAAYLFAACIYELFPSKKKEVKI